MKFTFFTLSILTIFSCSKESSSSIVGKWYNASVDTKLQIGGSCNLKDTTKYKTKGGDAHEFEFSSDGKYKSTLNSGGVAYSESGIYTFNSGKLVLTINGSSTPEITISGMSSDGWRLEQKNFIWCPSKTAFIEYYNYKKY